jgi:hypothetical protein
MLEKDTCNNSPCPSTLQLEDNSCCSSHLHIVSLIGVQLMGVGQIGKTGRLVQLLVKKVSKQGQEHATTQLLSMVVPLVKDLCGKIRVVLL